VTHWITLISVVGIAVITAALIILIAAFNGIESMVEKMYTSFDPHIIITSNEGKTIPEKSYSFAKIKRHPNVLRSSKAIEEIVIVKHEKKWVNARMFGVEDSYLKMINVADHVLEGNPILSQDKHVFGITGAVLLDKLQGYIPQNDFESVIVYFPKRTANVTALSNPFRTDLLKISSRVNYNREVNDDVLLVPYTYAQNMLDLEGSIQAVYIQCKNLSLLEQTKEELKQILGKKFNVKTHLEKNALIYQTSKTEKLVVIAILVFVFILAVFNLIASLTMLYIEKKPSILTLQSMGASNKMIFSIFFNEGLLISFTGIFIGLILGFGVASLQYYGQILTLPNSNGQAFPMWITWKDSLLVFAIVSIISILASYLTISYLIKNFKALRYEQ
jgi:lipoprotein-releasing system permease protein